MEIGNLKPVMVCKENVVHIPTHPPLRITMNKKQMTSTDRPRVHLVLAKTTIIN